MNERELMNAESAYGSETYSNPDSPLKRDTFTMEEPRRQTRYQWIKFKLREYMILEAIVLIQLLILVFLLITCTRNTSQNQETQIMISGIKSELNSLQKLIIGKDFMNQEAKKVDENEPKKTEEVQIKRFLQVVPRKSTINSETNSKGTSAPTIVPTVTTKSTPKGDLSERSEQLMAPSKLFNSASLIVGATIDTSLSSSSSLNPFFGFDQSSLVLVDRLEPPSSKAWCTFDKNPVLTVSLGYRTNPTSVSYQHSKWNGTIPDEAPRMYSVVACLDYNCIDQKPLFSNCEYNQHGLQEQICNNISKDAITSPVAKLQFLFHKNHGNTERTCVSLVRVYIKPEFDPKQEFVQTRDEQTCINLNYLYHHNPIIYKYFSLKTCDILYSSGCCQECPECCEECEIQDFDVDLTCKIIFVVACVTMVIMAGFWCFCCTVDKPAPSNKRKKRNQGVCEAVHTCLYFGKK